MALRRHLLVLLGALLLLIPAATHASTLPSGFQETVVFSGLTNPTVVRFASDGRVFVAEKSGIIKVFDNLSDHDADHVRRPAHKRPQLLGSRPARDGARPGFPTNPYVYVLYTHDAAIGGTAPAGDRRLDSDPVRAAGRNRDGCVIRAGSPGSRRPAT